MRNPAYDAPERPALIDQLNAQLGGHLRVVDNQRVLDVGGITITCRPTGKVMAGAFQIGKTSDRASDLAAEFNLLRCGIAAGGAA